MNYDRMFRSDSKSFDGISRIHSGYNDYQQTMRASDEDIFFFDVQFPKANGALPLSCHEVLGSLIHDLDRERIYSVLNAGSQESLYLISLLREAHIRFEVFEVSRQIPLNPGLASLFFRKYRMDSPDLFHLAQIASFERKPLLCPHFSFRVINSVVGSGNDPYWTLVFNERFHLFDQFCQEAGLEVIWNWFHCSVNFYPAYFNEKFEQFLNADPQAAHNVKYDSVALPEASRFESTCVAPETSKKFEEYLVDAKRMAQASYPLHLLYEKLGLKSQLNFKYRMLYGS